MSTLNDTLHFNVTYHDGQEDGDGGIPYYVASCQEIAATTDGQSWHDLLQNIHDMLQAYFENEDLETTYQLTPNPRVVLTMELPENYVEIA